MLTTNRLFIKRILRDWKFQFNVIKTAVDWTVLLYILLPAVGFGMYYYVKLWSELPAWADYIQFPLLILVLYIFTWSGSLRVYIEEADQLFLIQKRQWIQRLVKLSICYSMLLQLIVSVVLVAILAPFLVLKWNFTISEVMLLTVFVLLFKASISCFRQLISIRFAGFKAFLLMALLCAAGVVLFAAAVKLNVIQHGYLWLAVIISGFVTSFCLSKRYTMAGTFFFDVSYAEAAKWKLANLLLSAASLAAKQPVQRGKQPFLLPNSTLLFRNRNAANGLVEAFIKICLRNRANFFNYLRLLAIWVAGLLVVPGWTRWILLPAFALMMAFWAKMLLEQFLAGEFLRLFNWSFADTWAAARKSVFMISLPGVVLVSAVLGFLGWHIVGAIVMLPAGGLLSFMTASVVSVTLRNSRKR